jgi:hypothetical protein
MRTHDTEGCDPLRLSSPAGPCAPSRRPSTRLSAPIPQPLPLATPTITTSKHRAVHRYPLQDVPLFNGILSDLFPGVELPTVDYDNLVAAIKDSCVRNNLQPLDSFIIKVIQVRPCLNGARHSWRKTARQCPVAEWRRVRGCHYAVGPTRIRQACPASFRPATTRSVCCFPQLYEMIIVRHGLMLVGHSYGMKTAASRVLAEALSDLHTKGLNKEHHTKYHVINPKVRTQAESSVGAVTV